MEAGAGGPAAPRSASLRSFVELDHPGLGCRPPSAGPTEMVGAVGDPGRMRVCNTLVGDWLPAGPAEAASPELGQALSWGQALSRGHQPGRGTEDSGSDFLVQMNLITNVMPPHRVAEEEVACFWVYEVPLVSPCGPPVVKTRSIVRHHPLAGRRLSAPRSCAPRRSPRISIDCSDSGECGGLGAGTPGSSHPPA